MAWSPNSSRPPRKNKCGRNSSGTYQVLTQLWKLVPQRTVSGPLSSAVKPASAVPGSARTLRMTATASSGSSVSACRMQTIGAETSATPRLMCAARPRRSNLITRSPAASANSTEPSVLPPSRARTSAGCGSSTVRDRSSRGSTAASFSMGMTIATPLT